MTNSKKTLRITARVFDGDQPRTVEAVGRYGQALSELVKAGPDGIYIDVLRKDDRYRLDIKTVMEPHEIAGMGPGRHARYVLRTPVEILPAAEAA